MLNRIIFLQNILFELTVRLVLIVYALVKETYPSKLIICLNKNAIRYILVIFLKVILFNLSLIKFKKIIQSILFPCMNILVVKISSSSL